jgi:hypothetical protein
MIINLSANSPARIESPASVAQPLVKDFSTNLCFLWVFGGSKLERVRIIKTWKIWAWHLVYMQCIDGGWENVLVNRVQGVCEFGRWSRLSGP